MRIMTFALFILFYSCICNENFLKLEINQTIEGNINNYFYFKVEQENEFIQIKYYESFPGNVYIKPYKSVNETEIFNNPPTINDRPLNNFKYYYFDESKLYSYFYLPKNESIKMICFKFSVNSAFNLNIAFKRGQLFLVDESQELKLNNVFLNAYYINETILYRAGDSFGYYSKDNTFKIIKGVNSDSKSTTLESNIYLITPNSNLNIIRFIILEDINISINFDIKKFQKELYKVFYWTNNAISFQVTKEDCQKTIIGLENVPSSRNEPSVIDYLRAYGDLNMYLSRNVGKSSNFNELINSANENILNYVITNKDYNFYKLNCTEDSYLTIFSKYTDANEYNLNILSTIVTYLTKGRTLKYNFKVKTSEDFYFNITILNKDINLKEGDLNIKTDTRNIAITEKDIIFHHNPGETFFMFDNKNYDLMLKIDFGEKPSFNYIFSEVHTNKQIYEYNSYQIAYKPKIIEPISGYKTLYHTFNAINIYPNGINGLFLTQETTRSNIIKEEETESLELNLDNEVLKKYIMRKTLLILF